MKLNAMLFLSFGIILLFVALIGVIAQIELNRIWQYSHHLYNHVFMVNKSLRDIQKNVYLIQIASMNIETDLNLSDKEIGRQVTEIDKYAKETEQSFIFLYRNYLGPKTDMDSAYIAFTSWKPKSMKIESFSDFSGQDMLYSGKILRWIQVMTNFNFETVESYFIKAQSERAAMKKQLATVIVLIFISSFSC